jgi:molybdopterin converting factor small subunit
MIKVELFAAFAEFAGTREISVPFRSGITCEDLWADIRSQYPRLSSIPPLFAIGNEYVRKEYALKDGDAVFLFPPVSGG